jgi:phosphatidate cytidylyltransferase
MIARVASALVLIPLVLALVFLATPFWFLMALGAVGSVCMYEYLRLAERMGMKGFDWYAYGGFWALLLVLHRAGSAAVPLFSALVLLGFVLSMWRQAPLADRARGLMGDLLGIFYLALCLYPALPVRFHFGDEAGRQWLLLMLATVWAGDTAALFVGRRFGRHPFAPVISPRKTNEGALGGLLGGTAAALVLKYLAFDGLALHHVVAASLLIGMSGQLGDLAESMLKRAAGVKDSSDLIPGHGGMLDRIDSLLFALPVTYYIMLFLNRP